MMRSEISPIHQPVITRQIAVFAMLWLTGCTGPIFRPQSPEAVIDEPPSIAEKLISDYTHPYGMNHVQVESVSLATGLAGTGEDPPTTPQRAVLLSEMNRRKVENPNQVLASPDTALITVRGILRPGIRKGERFDVEVRVPGRSEATSLRSGWLLETELTELAVLGQQIRKGHILAKAEGPILVDPSADEDEDPALATRGRILGGGVALKSRSLGLVIANPHQSVRLSQEIANAINRRFSIYENGKRRGVATPKTDEFIELSTHPRYKDNTTRYMRVVRNIAVDESIKQLQERVQSLERQASDPLTAAAAAIRLEAIGDEQAIEILLEQIESPDAEVRFYAAESLAYLDKTEAVKPLADAAKDEPAFRVNALAALSAMDDVIAYDALRSLLDSTSAETRYGAFRALWAMNPHDPLIRPHDISSDFSLHIMPVDGPPMVHVTNSYRPEIVLFGKDIEFSLPLVVDAGKTILLNGMNGDSITLSRFSPGGTPEQRVVSRSVEEVIRTIVEMGGRYPDVVQALQEAKKDGALQARFRVDALPEAGRTFSDEGEDDENSTDAPQHEVATPLPDLFAVEK